MIQTCGTHVSLPCRYLCYTHISIALKIHIVTTMQIDFSKERVHYFVSVGALILLLIGIFASARTAINLVLFEKYPSTGVLSFTNNYMQREEDCMMNMYPAPYYDMDGKPREATKEEKEMAKRNEEVCTSNVKASREMAKNNDIGISLFFLFLGAGVFVGKRFV